MPLRTRNLFGSLALAIVLALTGTARAQDAGSPPQPERNPLRAQKTKGAEAQPALPGDAPTVAWDASEVAAAKADCTKLLAGLPLEYETLPPLREGRCGAPAPILLKSIGSAPKVAIEPSATVTCRLAAALANWLDQTVQPEARAAFDAPVIKLSNASSYVCRNRYNGTETPLSEHALANALDISEFVLESGETATVLASWPRVAAAEAPPPPPNPARLSASTEVTGSLATTETAEATKVTAKSNPFVAAPADPKTNPFVRPAPTAQSAPPKPPTESTPPKASSASEFVRKVHLDACKTFGTVLGPEANDAHKDHFHFDMKPRRAQSLCQ